MTEKTKSNLDQREAIRTLAVAVGVREAARKTGINENTILSWSKRDNWFPKQVSPPSQAVDMQSLQSKPSKALAEVLQERSHKTKLHLSKAVLRASKELGKASGGVLLKPQVAGAARNWTAVAKDVHGWEGEKDEGKGLFGGLRIYANQAVIGVNTEPQGQPAEETGQG